MILRAKYVISLVICIIFLMYCSSGSDSVDPDPAPTLNKPYLLFPLNGQMMSYRMPCFEFKHTNPNTTGVFYEFMLSSSQSFSEMIYYESNIIPSSDKFKVQISEPLEQGKSYYYKAIARLLDSEDHVSSSIYQIHIEFIGNNIPNLFMSVGDSITDCKFPGFCYPEFLEEYLITYFGKSAMTLNEGIGGLTSWQLTQMIDLLLFVNDPAYTIIMIGINDIRDPESSCQDPNNCRTLENIIYIAQSCKDYNSIPIILTLIPATGYSYYDFDEDIRELNNTIKEACSYYGFEYIDLYTAIMRYNGNIYDLYYNDIHPSILGNEYIASVVFNYITNRVSFNAEGERLISKAKGLRADSIIERSKKSKVGKKAYKGKILGGL